MADKSIGDLPKAAALYDNDRMVLEQNGEAKSMEGALLKNYIAPYAQTAEQAAEAAESALEGVREAIENIPEGAATPIVNDLTTGGTSMALSAEMGKQLKSDMDGLTYTDVGAAPAGYGLGENGSAVPVAEDLNKCINNGWYWAGANVTNMPSGITYCSVFVRTRLKNQIVQELFEHLGHEGCVMVRRSNDGGATWVEEWVNPPMKLGVEYRTTERFNGKSVYVKLLDFGALPNTSTKTVSPGSNIAAVVSAELIDSGNGTVISNYYAITDFHAGKSFVEVHTDRNLSTVNAYVSIKYTKTTD